MSAETEYILFDRLSGNQLGEFDTEAAAIETYLDYVQADARATEHLEIWLDDTRLEVDPTSLPPATAA